VGDSTRPSTAARETGINENVILPNPMNAGDYSTITGVVSPFRPQEKPGLVGFRVIRKEGIGTKKIRIDVVSN
jgi:hypothetical protein